MIDRLLRDAAAGWRAERAFAALVDSPEWSDVPTSGLMALLRWQGDAPHAGVSITEFHRRYYCGSNAKYVVRAMEAAGLVEAAPDQRDARRVVLSLTADGRRLAAAIRATAQRRRRSA